MGNCSCTNLGVGTTANPFEFDIKKSIRKDPLLMEITNKFSASVLPDVKKSLDDLGRCLELAHFGLEPIQAAVILFEKKKKKNGPRRRHSMIRKLQELKVAAGDAFAGLSSEGLQPVLEQLKTLMEELSQRKEELSPALSLRTL